MNSQDAEDAEPAEEGAGDCAPSPIASGDDEIAEFCRPAASDLDAYQDATALGQFIVVLSNQKYP